jgi:KDO2-lipid IV(A) lauroyltransferase
MKIFFLAKLVNFLSNLLQSIPEKFAFWLGICFANFLYFLLKLSKYRNFISNNIKTAFGEEFKKGEVENIARGHLQNLVKSLIEFIRFPLLNAQNIEEKVEVKGLENFEGALSKGKGIILLTAHFGNWELLGATLSLKGYPLNALAQKQSNSVIENLFTKLRQSKGTKVLSRWDNLKIILKLLKENEIIVILADQHGEFKNVFAQFFRKRVSVPGGPAGFALKSGAEIVPAFIVRLQDDRHQIIIEKPLEIVRTGDKRRDLEENSQKIIEVIEKYIRRFPNHWLWSYNRWDKL